MEALPTYHLIETTAKNKKEKWTLRSTWEDLWTPSLMVNLEINGLTEKEMYAIEDNIKIRDSFATIMHIVADLREADEAYQELMEAA